MQLAKVPGPARTKPKVMSQPALVLSTAPIRVDVDAPAVTPKRSQVVIGVGNVVAGAAIPDFEIDDIAFATVYEVVPVRLSLWKPGGHPRPEHRLPGVGYQSRLAFEHHHELVFERVPMAQRRGGARRQARQVHAE